MDYARTELFARVYLFRERAFKRLPNMRTARALHCSLVFQDHLYVFGGKDDLDSDCSTPSC
jgi:hypothetical protein